MIKPKFTINDTRKAFRIYVENQDRAIIMKLSLIGETFINNARANGKYTDQTGNLRSSIGYIVARNGKKVIGSSFEVVKNGREGSKKAIEYITKLLYDHKKGYVLICIAGLEYAAAVESKGKDVLTGSSIEAKRQLRVAFKQK